MVDTAGTLTKAADLMIEQELIRASYLYAWNLFREAYARIDNSNLEEIVITNTIPRKHLSNKGRNISCRFIRKYHFFMLSNKSISDNFIC